MSSAPSSQARTAGRPRCDATHRAVLRAAYELLAEAGLRQFTIEGVAARSGVARTTIYRWWPSKGALAMEGFLAATAAEISFPMTRSAVADLKAHLRRCARLLRGAPGRIMAGIVAEGQSDPETLAAFTEHYLRPRRREAMAILERAVENGELRPDLDLTVVQSALYASLHLRHLLQEPVDDDWVDRLADTVLQGCTVK
ncbi:TetR/AcrR family transcriptional regulator [Rhodovastum atsumiense]|uniref:TetR/AcrR family transcriptional regulator n=1 Tax=Rhodovastum atsumiense TaxID=504468 RepID=A0A5M6INC9_9PROT|nr:TetR/AcrR family transcriptional regulator [Rhodovastum atsumiense]KAA5609409.1 TetR/AcrR family transcriptional regulator [Rhodovastum atsumiense]CAH2601832.1 TetR/AcrR family transcriptional regulator [Rhodovastum atsumiense]